MITNKSALQIKYEIDEIITNRINYLQKQYDIIIKHHGTTLDSIVLHHQITELKKIKDEMLEVSSITEGESVDF